MAAERARGRQAEPPAKRRRIETSEERKDRRQAHADHMRKINDAATKGLLPMATEVRNLIFLQLEDPQLRRMRLVCHQICDHVDDGQQVLGWHRDNELDRLKANVHEITSVNPLLTHDDLMDCIRYRARRHGVPDDDANIRASLRRWLEYIFRNYQPRAGDQEDPGQIQSRQSRFAYVAVKLHQALPRFQQPDDAAAFDAFKTKTFEKLVRRMRLTKQGPKVLKELYEYLVKVENLLPGRSIKSVHPGENLDAAFTRAEEGFALTDEELRTVWVVDLLMRDDILWLLDLPKLPRMFPFEYLLGNVKEAAKKRVKRLLIETAAAGENGLKPTQRVAVLEMVQIK